MQKGLKTLIGGIVFLLIGVLVIPLILIFTFLQADKDAQQFVIPGQGQIQIEHPGQYYLWNDFQTVHNGRTYNQSPTLPNGLDISVTDASGKALDFISSTEISVTHGSSARNSIGFIDVTSPGMLTVSVDGDIENRIFSVSTIKLGQFFNMVLASLACAFIGALMLIFGIIKLVKNKKAAQA